jgi:hypothetical protein
MRSFGNTSYREGLEEGINDEDVVDVVDDVEVLNDVRDVDFVVVVVNDVGDATDDLVVSAVLG